MKVVINRCYGGFSVSRKVYRYLKIEWDGSGFISNEDLGIKSENYYAYRTDKRLVEAVEKIGKKSNGDVAKLKIVEIPDNIEWEIEEYDGLEWIAEKHRTWR